jgi:hypothetical protein
MRARAQALGFDISVLVPVQQEGCVYPELSTLVAATTAMTATAGVYAASATGPAAIEGAEG